MYRKSKHIAVLGELNRIGAATIYTPAYKGGQRSCGQSKGVLYKNNHRKQLSAKKNSEEQIQWMRIKTRNMSSEDNLYHWNWETHFSPWKRNRMQVSREGKKVKKKMRGWKREKKDAGFMHSSTIDESKTAEVCYTTQLRSWKNFD